VQFAAQERILVAGFVTDRTDLGAHAPVRDHAASDAGSAFQIVLRADGRFLVDDLFGGATAEQHNELVFQLALRNAQAILVGHVLSHAQGAAPRDDCHLVDDIRPVEIPGRERVARLVIGRLFFLRFLQDLFAFRPHQDLVAGVVEVGHFDDLLVISRGPQRGLVDHVADVGTGQTDRASRQTPQIDIVA